MVCPDGGDQAGRLDVARRGRAIRKSVSVVASVVILLTAVQLYPRVKATYRSRVPEEFGPDPLTDGITYTLPADASKTVLSLPNDLADIFAGGLTGASGFGLHALDHVEGLDHIVLDLRQGVPVGSWAEGVVTQVYWTGEDYQITIDYGGGLVGTYMEITTPYVKRGQRVARGQPVGLGMGAEREVSSAEFALLDRNRHKGVAASDGQGGVYVSPYDYLEYSQKMKLVEVYRRNVLDRMAVTAGGSPLEPTQSEKGKSPALFPYQPYLTNQIMLHEGNQGRLTGEWYSTRKWGPGLPVDILTFIEASNPYFRGNVLLSNDDGTPTGSGLSLKGTFEVDYAKKQVKINALATTDLPPTTYYGIFEIDESGKTATLKLEYQTGSYPTVFSDRAVTYVTKPPMRRRPAGKLLGVRDSDK